MNQVAEVYYTRPLFGGTQNLYRFDNGYGASVIKHVGSYGYAEGLWELAVVYWLEDTFCFVYDTAITDDVIGGLTYTEVEELLVQIQCLTPDEVIH